ncbi:hypothetical protein DL765_002958 [Monosporascus sp. GIB2]|nr:hypothetical protein DL765_002958 [Monosporascus sp. GIB2]
MTIINEKCVATRAQALTLYGSGASFAEINRLTGYTRAGFNSLRYSAQRRGWVPGGPVRKEHVVSAARAGRPRKATSEKKEEVRAAVTKNSTTRSWSSAQIAAKVNERKPDKEKISRYTVLRILKTLGLRPVKWTTKPGLNSQQIKTRYRFCLKAKNWSNTYLHSLVWSDETSVQLGEYNLQVEPDARKEWELEVAMRRLDLARAKGGPKPKWTFKPEYGKQERNAKKGGIDWIRYREEVLKPLYLPFLEGLRAKYPHLRFVAQEDNAPSHASRWCRQVWEKAGVERLEWPPNSPDLNAIEPPWGCLKRSISKFEVPKKRSALEERWIGDWNHFPLYRFQRFVDRLRGNIAWVIYLKGGNNYKEGTWPPNGTKEKPGDEWLQQMYREAEEEVRLEDEAERQEELAGGTYFPLRRTRLQQKLAEEQAAKSASEADWEDLDD